jgi:CO/xanthine dehydrogenase FAD-binding subunit
VISLRGVDELGRITRTERFLEIGSIASISRILEVGRHLLPRPILLALSSIGNGPIRNMATLGGNISVPDTRLSAFPVLSILDVQTELRESSYQRWVPVSQLFDPDDGIRPGETVTRIRIPFEQWSIHTYKRIGSPHTGSSESVSFCGLGRTQKGILTDFRYIFGSLGTFALRNQELEAALIGRKLPLQEKEISWMCENMTDEIETRKTTLSLYQRTACINLFWWFLKSLGTE